MMNFGSPRRALLLFQMCKRDTGCGEWTLTEGCWKRLVHDVKLCLTLRGEVVQC